MTLNELLARGQDLLNEDEEYGEREVYLVYQPTYPLQSTVRGFRTSEEAESNGKPVIYIVEGSQPYDAPYGPRGAFDAIY